MKLTFRVTGREATLRLNRPSKDVVTPLEVPSTITLAANMGSPVSPSKTLPTMETCPQAPAFNERNKNNATALQNEANAEANRAV